MMWSARIEDDEFELYQGDRLVLCNGGIPSASDAAMLVNALNAYCETDVLLRNMVSLKEYGEMTGHTHGSMEAWCKSAESLLAMRKLPQIRTRVTIGDLPRGGYDDETGRE